MNTKPQTASDGTPFNLPRMTVRRELFYGRRLKQWVAEFGRWSEVAEDKLVACQRLWSRIQKQEEYQFTRRHMHAVNGTVFLLYYADGWSYDLLHPDGQISTTMMGRDLTYPQALERMKRHFDQYNENHQPVQAA